MSINNPDESMAVNASMFTARRLQELEPEFEDQDLEDEIDQLARERAASACRKPSS